jgi:hypothetical protein
MHRSKLLAQIVQPVIIELLLTETVGRKAELQYRHARSVVLHHNWRLDARGQRGADCVCRRDDLRNGKVEVDVGLEINLLDRDAVKSLRLHVLDAGHVGTHRVLAVGRDPLLHLRHA